MTMAESNPTVVPATGPVPPSSTAAIASAPGAETAAEPRYFNRELQWLEFNDRVLYQSEDDRNPLLERVRFLAIHASNLDEFFMKRVGALHRQIAAGVDVVAYEGVSPQKLLADIRAKIIPVTASKADIFRKLVRPALEAAGIELLRYDKLTDAERAEVDHWYSRNVFPILTPLAVDPGHRFPFISNLSVSLGIMLRRPGESERLFARVKVPEAAPSWYQIPGTKRFVSIVDIIEHNLDDLFPGMEIVNVLPFRVTRNADVEGGDDDAEDLLEQIQAQLRERRFAPVVRLQIGRKPPKRLLKFLSQAMEIHPEDIYETKGLIDYTSLHVIANLDLPQLKYSSWTPVTPPRLRDPDQSIFSVIREGDLLVHHPYESFDDSVERFIEEAAADPQVLCIKMALYRTSGDSPFVHELIRAAESGKQVAVLVELRARFDEARNIEWARKLEDAGVHVAYGVVGLKTHTKIALVIRQEGDRLRAYAHLGTGNYHSRTARLYEDLGLFTCDGAICEDVIDLFNYITGRSRHVEYEKLLVAPHTMKRQILGLIEREIKVQQSLGTGRIIAKMNQLQDREVIDKLYEASAAGVKVDLIVRGFCTLRPGVRGMSENIRLMSIIGRFLEHSRIFWFSAGHDDPLKGDFFIGSADWMYRNLHTRVEAVCPIQDPVARARMWQILQIGMYDQRQCWDCAADGSYTLRRPPAAEAGGPDGAAAATATTATTAAASNHAAGTHQRLMDLTLEAARSYMLDADSDA